MVARVSRLKINFRYNKLSDYVFLFTIIKRKLMQVESNTKSCVLFTSGVFLHLMEWSTMTYTLH